LLQAEQDQVFAVVCDHLGTPKELVDEHGRLAWAAAHSAWGCVVEVYREPNAVPAVESPFRLLGQYADDDIGLCYTRYRWFDVECARWLSPDPLRLAGGSNLLAFDGSPCTSTDPWGLACRIGDPRTDEFIRNGAAIPEEEGYYDVVVHGSPESIGYKINGVWHRLTPEMLANHVMNRSDYQGQAVRLISCSTGALPNGFAQKLANKMGVTVKAPGDTVWSNAAGKLLVGPDPTTPSGDWRKFKPQPAT
jgi:RHS repeat-associated protein